MAHILLPDQLTIRVDQESKEMKPKYVVKLTESERLQLKELISSGEASARQIRRAYILLKSDSSPGGPSWKYKDICDAYEVSSLTVYNVPV
jgi:hypothetical protein